MVLFLHISGFVSYSRFRRWGHLLWQKSYAARVWLWMRPSSSNPWCKLNYSRVSVFNCKNTVYMQRAVGEGAEGESDSQVCAVGIRMHPQSHRTGRVVSRYTVSRASWCDSRNHTPHPPSVKLCPVHRTDTESPKTENKWLPKQTREEQSGCPLCTDLPSPIQGQSDASAPDFGKPFSKGGHTDAVWML